MRNSILFCYCFLSGILSAQLSQEDVVKDMAISDLRMCSNLYNLAKVAATTPSAIPLLAEKQNLQMNTDGKAYVLIADGWDTERTIDTELLNALDIEVKDQYRNIAGCWIKPIDFISVAQQLPEGYLMRSANRFSADHEGVLVTNSLSYKDDGGAQGQGIKIAVIDLGFLQLDDAQDAGTAPDPPADTVDLTGTGLMTGTVHGTGCTEITFEYATQATYYLYKFSGEVQHGNAINQAINNGVDLITCSVSFYNTGWADGSGTPCASVRDATDAGILYFHGGGNFHQDHWQGIYNTTDGDDWHEFTGGGDETNEATVSSGNNNSITVNLQWEGTPSSTNDYDLYLFDEVTGNLLASATLNNDFETLNWVNNTGSSVVVEVAVLRFNSSQDEFEIFVSSGQSLQFNQTGGSTASPSNSLEDLCITVGAIDWSEYDDADPQAESFSSRGPTNGGRIVPDLIAPDDLTLVTYPNGFSGSSAGGPNTCGMTAVLWSEHDYLSATGIKELVRGLASLYNDWGDPGKDNTYGEGGLYLPDFTNNSRFIYKGANNTGGLSTLPYLTMQQANDLAPDNSNIFFLGDVHEVPAGVISTPMQYRSLHEDAIINE